MGSLLILLSLAALIIVFKKITSNPSSDQPVITEQTPIPRLPIELVPIPMHGCNVRSRFSGTKWKYICNTTHDTPKYKLKSCVICGENGKAQGFRHALECHEQWKYDTTNKTQKLVKLLSICPMCHKVFHYALTQNTVYADRAYKHLKKVNHWNDSQAKQYISEAYAKVEELNNIDWKLDLTYLNKSKFHYLKTKLTTDEKANCDISMGEY